ncbi:MAG: hypothetical protein AAGF92_08920 [Myxococcota bacterium]
MRVLMGATTVARVLIGLGRAEASGTLDVRADGRPCPVRFDRGRVVGGGVAGHEWSDPEDVIEALLRRAAVGDLTLRFVEHPHEAFRLLHEPIHGSVLGMRLVRSALRALDVDSVRRELGRDVYRLTSSGEALVNSFSLRPDERAVVFWLRRGVGAEDVIGLPGCGVAGYRFLCALKLVGAASPRGGDYPLMLRKRRQVRASASPQALLDLPEEATAGDARRALRRLVRNLHPDRFIDEEATGLRRASSEVVTALVAAEATLSSSPRK